MDFSRCRYNFEPGDEKIEYMTAYLRELRAGLDQHRPAARPTART